MISTLLAIAIPMSSYQPFAIQPTVDSLVQDADLRWSAASDDFYDAAFFGDGVQGGAVLRDSQDPSSIRLLLGHYQAIAHSSIPGWEYCVSRVYAGSALVKPRGKAVSQPVHMDLWNGLVSGSISTDLGEIKWKAFADRVHNVVVLTASGTGGEARPQLDLREEWGVTARYWQDQVRPAGFEEHLPPKPRRSEDGQILFAIQEMKTKGAHVVAALPLTIDDSANGLILAVGTSDLGDTAQAAQLAQADATKRVLEASKSGIPSLETRHRAWWHDYWHEGAISLPQDPEWQRFWYLQLYKFASASSESAPLVIDTVGPWVWKSDWAAVWWNLNVQLSYMPMYSSNRLEVGKSLTLGLDRLSREGALRTNAGDQPGMMIGRSTDYTGRGSWGDELANLAWALHCVWKEWSYSRDESTARLLFPLLKESVEYLSAQMIEEPDGTLIVRPSRSPEFKDDTLHLNANYTLMTLDWALRALLALDRELGMMSQERAQWRETLVRLSPFPTDEHGFRISSDQPFDMSHRHYSHLLAIYPYHTVNPDQGAAAADLIRRSLSRWLSLEGGHSGYTYTGGSAMHSVLKDGDMALQTLNRLKPRLTPNTMYQEGSPVIETPLSAVESINYMLLQSWGGILRIFPATPRAWSEASFYQLRTEGAFLVSASQRDQRVLHLEVTSEAGLHCRVENPWPGRRIIVQEIGGRSRELQEEGPKGLISFSTRKGSAYRLYPADTVEN